MTTYAPSRITGLLALSLTLLCACGGGGGGSSAAPAAVAPGAPGIGAVTGGDGTVSVAFTAPAQPGSSPITSYTATCSGGAESRSGTGSASPITVANLTNGTAYSCSVTASSAAGTSPSSASATVTPYAVASALPVLSITTDNGQEITSEEVYTTARYKLTETDGRVLAESTLEIRGRGHSTWNYPKKPYRLKLSFSTDLMGMPANRHWVLLANYVDKTLVRTEAALELSQRMGFAWTPRSAPVVLELNGSYRGIYQLVEHVRIGSQRVNIPELKAGDTDPALISGGYLIEIDERKGEDYCPESARTSVMFCFANPETLLQPGWEPHKAYIDGYLAATENALYSSQFASPTAGYAAFIDVDSAIDWYIVNELFKNVDSNFFSSVFVYKKRGGKLTFGPVWDFDLSIGNANFFGAENPEGWRTRSAPWFTRLFQDPAFEQRVKARWAQLRDTGVLEDVYRFIDRRAAYYSGVQARNFERWDVLNTTIPLIRPVTGPYSTQVSEMKTWLRRRQTWMDGQLR